MIPPYAGVVSDFVAEGEGELSASEGAFITLLETAAGDAATAEGWVLALLRDQVGFIPAAFVQPQLQPRPHIAHHQSQNENENENHHHHHQQQHQPTPRAAHGRENAPRAEACNDGSRAQDGVGRTASQHERPAVLARSATSKARGLKREDNFMDVALAAQRNKRLGVGGPCETRFMIDPRKNRFVPYWDFVTSASLIFVALVTPFEVRALVPCSTVAGHSPPAAALAPLSQLVPFTVYSHLVHTWSVSHL